MLLFTKSSYQHGVLGIQTVNNSPKENEIRILPVYDIHWHRKLFLDHLCLAQYQLLVLLQDATHLLYSKLLTKDRYKASKKNPCMYQSLPIYLVLISNICCSQKSGHCGSICHQSEAINASDLKKLKSAVAAFLVFHS